MEEGDCRLNYGPARYRDLASYLIENFLLGGGDKNKLVLTLRRLAPDDLVVIYFLGFFPLAISTSRLLGV